MVTKKWVVETNTHHNVKIEHGLVWFGNRIRVWIEEELVYERKPKLFDFGDEYRFKIEDKPCIIRILPLTFCFQYELWGDGKLQ